MDAIVVLKATDNVATCLKDLAAGQLAEVMVDGKHQSVTLQGDIRFGHKIALIDLAKGDQILKYAEVIGVASQPICAGEHVHVHNVESIRARGDKVTKDGVTKDGVTRDGATRDRSKGKRT